MPKNKPESKRMRMRLKYSIQKKVQEHDRKARRMAKKNPTKYGKQMKKDPGIPNLYPFKAQLMLREKRANESLKAHEQGRQQRLQAAARRRREDAATASATERTTLADMAAAAASRGAAFQEAALAAPAAEGGMLPDPNQAAERQTRRAFMKHMRTVVERADVILEVLDARDPLGCRSPDVERYVLGASSTTQKRLVLVLNKIDLVPPVVVQGWLKYLRQFFPTIAFKASTQKQATNLNSAVGASVGRAARSGEVTTGSGAAGAEAIIQLVKNYSRSHGIKTAVTVGVVGYPNVGKSSLINSLKRSRVASVSSRAGHTTSMQEIALDSKLKVLDCPGIIFGADDSTGADGSSDGGAALLLRNCITVEAIPDPAYAVQGILSRCHPDKIAALYAVPRFASTEEFLVAVAYKRNMLGKGGKPNVDTAAKAVLMDWNSGKIPFFTMPPTDAPVSGSAGAHDSMEIVQEWATEFDIDSLPGGKVTVEGKPTAADTKGFVALTPSGMVSLEDDEDDEDVSLGEQPAASGGGFHLGATQNPRRMRASGAASGTVAGVAAGEGGDGEGGDEDADLASSMGLGKRRAGRKVGFLDPEEVAAGNRQDRAEVRAEARSDRRRVRKGVNRALRAEGVDTAPAAQKEGGGDDSYNFGEFF